jgi:hypothetical protein
MILREAENGVCTPFAHLLLPAANVETRTLRFSETTRRKYGIDCFETFPSLVRSLIRRIGNASPAARKVVPAAASGKRLKPVNRLANLALTQFWCSSYSAPINLA